MRSGFKAHGMGMDLIYKSFRKPIKKSVRAGMGIAAAKNVGIGLINNFPKI